MEIKVRTINNYSTVEFIGQLKDACLLPLAEDISDVYTQLDNAIYTIKNIQDYSLDEVEGHIIRAIYLLDDLFGTKPNRSTNRKRKESE